MLAVCGVLLCRTLTAQDQPQASPDANPKAVINLPDLSLTVTPKGVARYQPGKWGLVSLNTVNRKHEATNYRGVGWFTTNKNLQFGRSIWLPARSNRRTWLPVLIPKLPKRSNRFGPVPSSLELKYSAFSSSTDGPERYIDDGTDLRSEGQPLMVARAPSCFLLVTDPGEDDLAITQAVSFFVSRTYTNQVTLLGLSDAEFPMIPEALGIVDCMILSGDQVAESAAAVSAVRSWIRRGGRLWLMLDQVSLSTVELLLGDLLQVTELGRVTLNDFTIEPDLAAGGKSKSDVALETKVDLVRTFVAGGQVTHRVGEWPAAIRVPMGQGLVLCTTLGVTGWIQPTDELDRTTRQNGQAYRISKAATDLVSLALRARAQEPIKPDVWKEYLADQIGYTVPSRFFVMGSLIGYCLAFVVAAVWFRKVGRIERLLWFTPAATVVVALVLVGIGRANNKVESSVHIGQIIEVEPGLDELSVSGMIGAYNERLSRHSSGVTQGGMFMPDQATQTSMWRMNWRDFDQWNLEDLDYPTGSIRFAPFTTMVPTTKPISVRGTFNESGFQATVERGPLEPLQDQIVANQSRITMPLEASNDGKTVVGKTGTELPPGEYFSASLLSDEQQRRQKLIRKALVDDHRMLQYPNGPILMAWTDPIETGFQLPLPPVGSALVTIPFDLIRPEPASKISIPAPFLTYKSVRGDDGGVSSVFKNSTGVWASSSAVGNSTLRFQVPPEMLPLEPNSATLKITLTAPSRTVSFSSGVLSNLKEIASFKSPVGELQIKIDDPAGLRLDDHGGLHVAIQVGDVDLDAEQQGEHGTRDQSWRIDYVRLDLNATIE